MGLVTFGSEVENTAEFSSDFAEIQANLAPWSSKQALTAKQCLEALEKAAEFDYRPSAVRLVVLITDKPYYQAGQAGAGQTDLTTTELALKLYLKEIIPMVLAPDQPDFRGLVEEAGGLFFKLDIDRLSTTLCLIGRILGSQTVITYVSSDKQPDDGVRKLKVTITHNGQTHVAETLFVVGSARVAVTPADIIGRVGASFEVAVETTSMVDLGMAHFYLQYDAAKIKAEQVVEGDFLSQGGASTTFVADIEPTNSRIDITATRFDSQQIGASGSGVLCRVRFTVLVENCASTLTLSAAERVFKKLNDTVIPVTTAGATLHPISTGGHPICWAISMRIWISTPTTLRCWPPTGNRPTPPPATSARRPARRRFSPFRPTMWSILKISLSLPACGTGTMPIFPPTQTTRLCKNRRS